MKGECFSVCYLLRDVPGGDVWTYDIQAVVSSAKSVTGFERQRRYPSMGAGLYQPGEPIFDMTKMLAMN